MSLQDKYENVRYLLVWAKIVALLSFSAGCLLVGYASTYKTTPEYTFSILDQTACYGHDCVRARIAAR